MSPNRRTKDAADQLRGPAEPAGCPLLKPIDAVSGGVPNGDAARSGPGWPGLAESESVPVPTKIPLTGLPLLLHKLRDGGLPWLVERVRDEARMPRTAAGQGLFRALRGIGLSLGGAPRRRAE